MHPNFEKADRLSREAIGAAIEVHRIMGPGLLESIYETCLMREFELRGIPVVRQRLVRIEYKGMRFEEKLRFDLLVDGEGNEGNEGVVRSMVELWVLGDVLPEYPLARIIHGPTPTRSASEEGQGACLACASG